MGSEEWGRKIRRMFGETEGIEWIAIGSAVPLIFLYLGEVQASLIWREIALNAVIVPCLWIVIRLNRWYYGEIQNRLSHYGSILSNKRGHADPTGWMRVRKILYSDKMAVLAWFILSATSWYVDFQEGRWFHVPAEKAPIGLPWGYFWSIWGATFWLIALPGFLFFFYYLRSWAGMEDIACRLHPVVRGPGSSDSKRDWVAYVANVREICRTYFVGYAILVVSLAIISWGWVVSIKRGLSGHPAVVVVVLLDVLVLAAYFGGPSWRVYQAVREVRWKTLKRWNCVDLDQDEEGNDFGVASLESLARGKVLTLRHGEPLSAIALLAAYIIQSIASLTPVFT